MSSIGRTAELVNAVWQTWRGPGLARRARYELTRRSGLLRSSEERWLSRTVPTGAVLRPSGITAPGGLAALEPPPAVGDEIVLYGAVPVPRPQGDGWHRHPLTGHRFDRDAHWSTMSDAAATAGDIKDVWEPSRLGWLLPRVRRWAATDDDTIAEEIWTTIEDWKRSNPPYRGPNWMCGQETSLRTITVMFVSDALTDSQHTTDARRRLVAEMVHDAVGRVAPTLGYALSQRNNHAISEAGFLWSASVLAPWLPDAARLRRRAARALTEAVNDQVDIDGSYSQHSPTYQRVALHVLLWCLAVSRATGEPVPAGVADAVARSVPHLRSLMAPGADGRVPNLGGNDGALVFDLGAGTIADLRPVVAHAAAATGQECHLGPGLWDQEAAWFGLSWLPASPSSVAPAVDRPPVSRSRSTHALTRGDAHAVLRAGPLSHRPAHADQLHVDIWLAGSPVAVDAGSYRYTAPAPWGNALADEEVHNLPRVPGQPQAVRAGRFFWRSWQEAEIVDRHRSATSSTIIARLVLPSGAALQRTVSVHDGLVVVVDRAVGTAAEVRWNLMPDADVNAGGTTTTTVASHGWQARFAHTAAATTLRSDVDDPTSGWHAPRYGRREPLTAITYDVAPTETSVAAFAVAGRAALLPVAVVALMQTKAVTAAGVAAAVVDTTG